MGECNMKLYSAEYCRRKEDQHWEMAGLARQDGDKKDEAEHTRMAKLWQQRVRDGGWEGRS
jgi:hypothetical protein